MKKTNRYLLILLTGILCACQEEDVNPVTGTNSFLPTPEATDATSELRRDFYEATECYLLFSDTLVHEYIGENAAGMPIYNTELLEMGWSPLNSNTGIDLEYGYIRNLDEQQDAYDFLVNELYPYMKDVMPYSILAVKDLQQYEEDYYGNIDTTTLLTFSNSRCTVMNLAELWSTDDVEAFALDFCCEFIFAGFGGDPDYDYEGGDAEEFFTITSVYLYGDDKHDNQVEYTHDWTDSEEEYLKKLYRLGFIEDADDERLPSQQQDGVAYIRACLTMTDEEFRTKFSEYNDVMEKYEIMKSLVEATGIKFE